FELGLEIGTDFADIMSVKEHDFALGDPAHARPLPAAVSPRYDADENQFVLVDREGFGRTQLILSRRGDTNGGSVSYRVELEPRETWDLRVDVVPSLDGEDESAPRSVERRFGEERMRVQESLAAWQLRVPQIRATWDDLRLTFLQSVADLAAL